MLSVFILYHISLRYIAYIYRHHFYLIPLSMQVYKAYDYIALNQI